MDREKTNRRTERKEDRQKDRLRSRQTVVCLLETRKLWGLVPVPTAVMKR